LAHRVSDTSRSPVELPFSLASSISKIILYPYTWPLERPYQPPLSTIRPARRRQLPTRPLSQPRLLDDDIVNACRTQAPCCYPLLAQHSSRTGLVPIMRCRKRFKEDAC
jgi:hypothetical protein